jgi:hypothetical protein
VLAFRAQVFFDWDMDFKMLKWLALFVVVIVQVGCATTPVSSDDSTPILEPSPTHDDSHGWGANLEQVSH